MTSYVRDAASQAKPPTAREQVFLNYKVPITPVDKPLLPFPLPAQRDARSYMFPQRVPGSLEIAKWNRDFFLGCDSGSKDHLVSEPLQHRNGAPQVAAAPIRPGAPTIITCFFPEKKEDADADGQRRSLDVYFKRFQALADTGEMVIFYTDESLRAKIEALRPHDPHWHVITPWASLWDVPNNRHERGNFLVTQPTLFGRFEDAGPMQRYNRGHLSGTYNAKAYVIFDGVQRAPFGNAAGPFIFYDSGWFSIDEDQSTGFEEVRHPGTFISDAKVARSVKFAGDTGVVVGEYKKQQPEVGGPPVDINHACFQNPVRSWEALHFLGGCVVGSARGMLEYAVRYMQTVEDMDANGFYVGREEFVMSFMAFRYPNTIFSIPSSDTPGFPQPWPIRDCHSGRWGPDDVAAIVDPVQTIFCRFYQPRQPNLPAVSGRKRLAALEAEAKAEGQSKS